MKTPSDWPNDVQIVGMEDLDSLGINRKTGALYWNGKQVVTKSTLSLATPERIIACVAAVGTFGTFFLNLGRVLAWWP